MIFNLNVPPILWSLRAIIGFALLCGGCNSPEIQQTNNTEDIQPLTNHVSRPDLAHLYTDRHLNGSFILYDASQDNWLYIDSTQADIASSPATTFKIQSTLYGLETGVVNDADDLFKWDGNDHGRKVINRDLTLREAFDHSAYWFHRDIARKAGPELVKHWLDTANYGNADTTGGFDRTWVAGALRITPREQIEFLRKVQREELPFSKRTYTIAKNIMIREDTLGYVMRAKTGWAGNDQGDTGWYVGWVETPDGRGPYFFANRVITTDTASTTFGTARVEIAMEVLKEEGYWPK